MITTPSDDLIMLVRTVLGNTPAWVRTDLSAKDTYARARAEEVLAAMIAAAIRKQDLDV